MLPINEMLMKVGDQIREGRRKKNLTQTELGLEIGYSMNGIAKIERGESDPKLSSLVKISRALEIDLDTLLGGSKERDIKQLLELFTSTATELAQLKEQTAK